MNMAQSTARLDISTSEYVHPCLYPGNFCGPHGVAQWFGEKGQCSAATAGNFVSEFSTCVSE